MSTDSTDNTTGFEGQGDYVFNGYRPNGSDSLALRASYMSEGYDIEAITAELRLRTARSGLSYDTIVGTGLSGAIVIPALAKALGKKWLLIRKGEQNHSGRAAEGDLGQRWLFVDDFTSTGRTRNRVKAVIERICDVSAWGTVYAGSFLYAFHQLVNSDGDEVGQVTD